MRKYRGKVRITKEMLASILGIPEELDILTMEYEQNREALTIIFRGEDETVRGMFEVGEAQEIPTIPYEMEWLAKGTVRRFKQMRENEDFTELLNEVE